MSETVCTKSDLKYVLYIVLHFSIQEVYFGLKYIKNK